jgi:hypothetical protein
MEPIGHSSDFEEMHYNCRSARVVSSAVEHCLHTAGVTGSIPVPPTITTASPVRAA